MRAVVQRVSRASVTVDGKIVGSISQGLLILLGVSKNDTEESVRYCVDKSLNLRIFEDMEEKMNLSLLDIDGEVLVVSQFTFDSRASGTEPSRLRSSAPASPAASR